MDEIDARTLYRLLQLRSEVFVLEQACPYQDPTAATSNPRPGTCGSPPTTAPWPPNPDPAQHRSRRRGRLSDRRVCTHRAHRGRGHTRWLMTEALAEIGDHECRIEAQKYLAEMYAGHGFPFPETSI